MPDPLAPRCAVAPKPPAAPWPMYRAARASRRAAAAGAAGAVAAKALRAAALGLRAAALALALGVAAAAGASPLGPLTAQSLRGEPLRAVVELPDADAPRVQLAEPAAYARFGLVRDPALAGARLRPVVEPDGKRFLRIETDGPIEAAEVVLLLEAGGGVRRAYRVRLDSPEPADRVAVRGVDPAVRTAADVSSPTTGPAATAGWTGRPGSRPAAPSEDRAGTASDRLAMSAPGSSAAPAADATRRDDAGGRAPGPDTSPAVSLAPAERPGSVAVAEGDTFESLAASLRPPGATVEQSALALWRANPAGFAGRPPRPIVGVRLTVPGEADVLAIEPAQARVWTMAALAAPDGAARPGEAPTATAAVPRPQAVATAATAVAPLAPAGAAPRPRGAGPPRDPFDVEIAGTLRRARELEQRVAALRAGFEATTRREEETMRALIEVTRRAALAAAPAR